MLEDIELPPGEKAIVSIQLPPEFIIVFEPVTHSAQFIDVPARMRRAPVILPCLLKLIDEPKAVGQVFNIGNGREITIGDLATKVKKMTGSSSEVVLIPYDQAYESGFEDMPRRVPDISKAAALIGYRPTVELDASLTDQPRVGVHHGRAQAGRASGHQHLTEHQPLLDSISVVERPRW